MYVLIFRDGSPDSVAYLMDVSDMDRLMDRDPSIVGYFALMPDGTPSLEHTPHVIGEPLCGSFDLS